nr:MAG TPA: hypothetical protein [Caudoviricetes sp.]
MCRFICPVLQIFRCDGFQFGHFFHFLSILFIIDTFTTNLQSNDSTTIDIPQ